MILEFNNHSSVESYLYVTFLFGLNECELKQEEEKGREGEREERGRDGGRGRRKK